MRSRENAATKASVEMDETMKPTDSTARLNRPTLVASMDC
jgi:hypothetical protein